MEIVEMSNSILIRKTQFFFVIIVDNKIKGQI